MKAVPEVSALRRVAELIARIDASADPNVRAAARELVQALMDFHRGATARMMEMVDAPTAQAMGRDDVVRPLLLLHDLHPESTEVRVRRALDRFRGVEFIALDGLDLSVRVTSAHPPARERIDAALVDAAPEIRTIRIEGLRMPEFVPLESLLAV